MALINTLRNKMGKVIVGFVAFAIVSFILADFLGSNSLFSGRDNSVGKIAGDKITLEQYQIQIDQFASNYTANFGRNPTEREMVTLRNQAWEIMIVEKAFRNEYAALGVNVGDEEIVDLVQGKNISPEITGAPIFVNQETGLFDRNILANFLRDLSSQPRQQQQQWFAFESNLAPARRRIKYENLLNKSTYVTKEEARRLYKSQTASADLSYLYVPFSAVNDSLVSATESELKSYLKNNSEDFKVKASKSISFVTFAVIASSEDTTFFKMDIEDVIEEFKIVNDDSLFAKINSDGSNFLSQYMPKQLPAGLSDQVTSLTTGEVYGPFLERDAFKIYKVIEVIEDTLLSARASHILFKWTDDTPESKSIARTEAIRVLNELKGGADFAEMASQYGTDATVNTGGDLGWFPENEMVKPFASAVFGSTKTGLLNTLVETEFGYHIIDVTNVKINKQFKIASIDRTIISSDETIDKAFRKADYFAGTNTNKAEFSSSAEADGYQVREATNIEATQSNIAGIGSTRQIVRWLFTEASLNEVSEVFEQDDSYVVVVMTNEIEEGTSSLDDVKFQVERAVLNAKKSEYIISKLSSLSGSVDEIAASYGEGAKVHKTVALKENSSSIPNVGAAPEAIGFIFTMEAGNTSAPLKTRSGVMVATVDNITPAPEIADYSVYKTQIAGSREGRTSYYISEAIKDGANIVDERYKFF